MEQKPPTRPPRGLTFVQEYPNGSPIVTQPLEPHTTQNTVNISDDTTALALQLHWLRCQNDMLLQQLAESLAQNNQPSLWPVPPYTEEPLLNQAPLSINHWQFFGDGYSAANVPTEPQRESLLTPAPFEVYLGERPENHGLYQSSFCPLTATTSVSGFNIDRNPASSFGFLRNLPAAPSTHDMAALASQNQWSLT